MRSYIDEDGMEEFEDYSSQLKTYEWRQKRKEILTRDNHTCLVCGNKRILENTIPYLFYSDGINPKIKSTFFCISPLTDDIKQFAFPTEALKDNRDSGDCVFHFDPTGEKFNIAAIKSVKNPDKLLWISSGMLEVHHTFYQRGYRAWEYPEDSLQTLCGFCHSEVHAKGNISSIKRLTYYGSLVGGRIWSQKFVIGNGTVHNIPSAGTEMDVKKAALSNPSPTTVRELAAGLYYIYNNKFESYHVLVKYFDGDWTYASILRDMDGEHIFSDDHTYRIDEVVSNSDVAIIGNKDTVNINRGFVTIKAWAEEL